MLCALKMQGASCSYTSFSHPLFFEGHLDLQCLPSVPHWVTESAPLPVPIGKPKCDHHNIEHKGGGSKIHPIEDCGAGPGHGTKVLRDETPSLTSCFPESQKLLCEIQPNSTQEAYTLSILSPPIPWAPPLHFLREKYFVGSGVISQGRVR